jgi:glucose/arabinose dehydrogenase
VAGLAACGAGGKGGAPATTATAGTVPAPARQAAGLRLRRMGSFDQPVYVTSPLGDRRRLFVVEQPGRIRIISNGRKLARPFLDISGRVRCCGEQGLLSMAFAPSFAASHRLYVDYTDNNGDTRVVEYRVSSAASNRAIVSSARLVLFQRQPEANHNGGLLQYGPDRLLYIGLGDGGGADDQHGSRGNAQRLGTLLGKILRIDPRRRSGRRYTIPRDNPFRGRRGARAEIYSYGLRNPWRFSFDRRTGDMAIADVGQGEVEEVDFARRGGARGANYGWRVFEGNRVNFPGERAPRAVAPVLTYTHSGGRCSITGGYVVRDPSLPAFSGTYLYGDYCDGQVHGARLRPGGSTRDARVSLSVPQLTSFGEDGAGHVYATSQAGGVYRIVG